MRRKLSRCTALKDKYVIPVPVLVLVSPGLQLTVITNSQSSASHLWGIMEKREAHLQSVPHLFMRAAGPEAVLPST